MTNGSAIIGGVFILTCLPGIVAFLGAAGSHYWKKVRG